MAEGNRKPPESDPEIMARLLELELAAKRAAWQRSHARLKSLRALSLFFLVLVVGGSFFAFYFFFPTDKMNEGKARQPNNTETSPSPTPRQMRRQTKLTGRPFVAVIISRRGLRGFLY